MNLETAVLEPRQRERTTNAYVRRVKPVFDRSVALAMLIFLAPVFALVALAVRVSMGPGVLYRQVRVGRDGEDFTILKFRTMRHDRRLASLPIDFPDRRRTHKTVDDPRHTTVGRFLRSTGVDELPQLVNVVRGEMSLVGPRPELAEVADRYGFRHHPRHDVLPGITGLWQISPLRDELLHENLHLDLDYLDELGLGTDLRILAGTCKDVFGRTGA